VRNLSHAYDTAFCTELKSLNGLMCRNEYAKLFRRSHDAVSRVYDESGNVIETHEHAGDFGEP
jgi:hypothetical protein